MSTSTSSSVATQQGEDKSRSKPLLPSDPSSMTLAEEKDAGSGVQTQRKLNSPPRGAVDSITKTATAQDWTGPDDPGNPRNWPFAKKVYHTIIPGLFAFIVTFGSSVYTPGYPEVMSRFHVSSTVSLLGLSLYVFGLAFGPVLAAPISETFGRRVVYLVSLPLAAVFTLGAGFSQNFPSLAICRFFAGFFGSPVLAVGVSYSTIPYLHTTPSY